MADSNSDALHHIVDKATQAAASDVSHAILNDLSGDMQTFFQANPGNKQVLNDALVEAGVLQQLVFTYGKDMDKNGDGDLTRGELQQTVDNKNPAFVPPLENMTAQYALDHFAQIDASNDSFWNMSLFSNRNTISPEEQFDFGTQALQDARTAHHDYQ